MSSPRVVHSASCPVTRNKGTSAGQPAGTEQTLRHEAVGGWRKNKASGWLSVVGVNAMNSLQCFDSAGWVTQRAPSGFLHPLVSRRTHQPPLTHIIHTTCLMFFSHTALADPSTDHSWALRACVDPLLRDWNCRSGGPRHTRLQTTESDLAPFNVGLATD